MKHGSISWQPGPLQTFQDVASVFCSSSSGVSPIFPQKLRTSTAPISCPSAITPGQHLLVLMCLWIILRARSLARHFIHVHPCSLQVYSYFDIFCGLEFIRIIRGTSFRASWYMFISIIALDSSLRSPPRSPRTAVAPRAQMRWPTGGIRCTTRATSCTWPSALGWCALGASDVVVGSRC